MIFRENIHPCLQFSFYFIFVNPNFYFQLAYLKLFNEHKQRTFLFGTPVIPAVLVSIQNNPLEMTDTGIQYLPPPPVPRVGGKVLDDYNMK